MNVLHVNVNLAPKSSQTMMKWWQKSAFNCRTSDAKWIECDLKKETKRGSHVAIRIPANYDECMQRARWIDQICNSFVLNERPNELMESMYRQVLPSKKSMHLIWTHAACVWSWLFEPNQKEILVGCFNYEQRNTQKKGWMRTCTVHRRANTNRWRHSNGYEIKKKNEVKFTLN